MGSACFKSLRRRDRRGKLTDAEMSLLAEETGYGREELREMERRFLHETPTGLITEDEFVQVFMPHLMSSAQAHRRGRGFARHVFRACDIDGNGKMDFREFLIALKLTSVELPREKIMWLFRMYDINRDGMVTLNEVLTVLSSLSEIVSMEEAKALMQNAFEIFERFDKNNDGQLSLDEVLEAGLALGRDQEDDIVSATSGTARVKLGDTMKHTDPVSDPDLVDVDVLSATGNSRGRRG